MWTKRGKACLILIFSTNTNCESMAYRSFRSEEYSARGVRKVTTGITVYQVTTLSKVPFSLLARSHPTHLSTTTKGYHCLVAAFTFLSTFLAFWSVDVGSCYHWDAEVAQSVSTHNNYGLCHGRHDDQAAQDTAHVAAGSEAQDTAPLAAESARIQLSNCSSGYSSRCSWKCSAEYSSLCRWKRSSGHKMPLVA